VSRIAFIDLLFHWPPTGGSWVHLKEIACRAQEAGHEVKLFVPHFNKYFPRGVIRQPLPIEVETLEFDEKTFTAEVLPKKFRERLESYKPDLVFVGDGYYLKPLLVNALGKDFKTILRIFGYEVLCFRNSMYLVLSFKKGYWNPFLTGPCDNHLLKSPERCYRCFISGWKIPLLKALVRTGVRAPLLHYPHEYLAAKAYRKDYVDKVKECFGHVSEVIVSNQLMADLLGPFHSKIHVIPRGIDINHFDIPSAENTGSIKRILMPGRVTDPLKGFKLLKAAAKMLYRRRQDFKIMVTLPDNHGRKYPPYIENVGWWKQEDLPGLYAKADIVVAPALWWEPFGIIPVEAMSCRRPVVAARSGGHLATIQGGETGLFFTPGDAKDLAEKLAILLDSNVLRTQMGQKGREHVVRELAWEVVMERYYRKIF
jgi:glycosyltransferase involved in cell wall biosynthesis